MERLAGSVILLCGWRRMLVALLAGAVGSLIQAPYDFFAAGFLSFTVLVWLLDGTAGSRLGGGFRQAFLIGWWFGFGYFLAGLHWIGNALLVEAEDFGWAWPFAVVALPAGLAIFYGLAAGLARIAWGDGLGRVASLAVAFGLAEWLRSFLLTGFPWNAIGYGAMPVPMLMQSLAIVGTFGMSALAVFVFAVPSLLADRRHLAAGVSLALLLVAAHVGYGYWRLGSSAPAPDAATLAVRIVQPSIAQGEKWDQTARDRIFGKLIELSTLPVADGAPRPDVIVWPETAFPFLLSDRPDALGALADLVQEGQSLVAGAVRVEDSSGEDGVRYYNSILTFSPEGEIVDAYDKVHLVPFGEYLPFIDLLSQAGIRQLVSAFPAFAAGTSTRAMTLGEGVAALPFICYEIIFPGRIGAAENADILLNLTNDAWFGDTAGPYQHFRQAQLRAVEAGRPLVRAANNGISGVVDAYGRIVDAFAIDAVGSLDVELALAPAETSSRRLGRWGEWLAFGLLVLIAAFSSRAARRRSN